MSKRECVNKYENSQDCPCKEVDCENHGVCCECVSYHRKNEGKPACMR